MTPFTSYNRTSVEPPYKIETVHKYISEQLPPGGNSISVGIESSSNNYNDLNASQLGTLDSIQMLEDNWDGNFASAPKVNIVQRSRGLIAILSKIGQKVYTIAPGPYGEVMIDIRNQEKSLEVIFYPDKSKFVQFSPAEEPSQGLFEMTKLNSLLYWLNK